MRSTGPRNPIASRISVVVLLLAACSEQPPVGDDSADPSLAGSESPGPRGEGGRGGAPAGRAAPQPSRAGSPQVDSPPMAANDPDAPACDGKLPSTFAALCAGCHNAAADDTRYPDLTKFAGSEGDLIARVRSGGRGMPAFDDFLSSVQELEQRVAAASNAMGEQAAAAMCQVGPRPPAAYAVNVKDGYDRGTHSAVMTDIGREPDTIHGTLHGPGYSGGNGIGAPSKLAMGRFADAYHVFAIEWEERAIRWYVDGKLYQTRTPADLPSGAKWVYDHPFFLLLNLAVGGQWPGNPDNTTTFPQTMKVDYVRVYDRE